MCHLLPLTVIKALQSLLVDDIQPDISLGWLWIKVPGRRRRRRRQWLKLKLKLSAPFERSCCCLFSSLFYCATAFNECHIEWCFESLHCHHHHRHQFLHLLLQLLLAVLIIEHRTVWHCRCTQSEPALFTLCWCRPPQRRDDETTCWWQLMMMVMTVCPGTETRLLNGIRILHRPLTLLTLLNFASLAEAVNERG